MKRKRLIDIASPASGWQSSCRSGRDVESWIADVGRFDHAIAYGQVFWPEFRIHDDCVLFAGRAIVISFDEEFSEDLLDYQVTFYHKPS